MKILNGKIVREKSNKGTKETALADEISKELSIPWDEVYFGALVGEKKIGWQGVFTAYRECQEGRDRAALFRHIIKEQKQAIWR